ncbi:hypothetical protein T4E_4374 [Trichinella pseudospiralis]|uniref:Uncharacterized protein n=1 Tax=Trichinella pseudospiralis TaxID=6337 RepID=A0A0V0YIU3_TRIPS|nr:hypothetical protein T4E_4374 [Trichinella pseudospiralis]KRY89086.1 hypothetical protein T4D_11948 [Trichinella pseudospiralis]
MAECEGFTDLQVISENLLSIDEVPDAEISLTTALTKATGGQGYAKCMCLSWLMQLQQKKSIMQFLLSPQEIMQRCINLMQCICF